MIRPDSALAPETWLHGVLSSKSVADGHVIRRKIRDIERFVGMDRFLEEIRLRGFRAIENRGYVIVICNQAPIRRLV
ncbi:aspartate aminotransferase [Marimonas arenosa]|uniref:Aspartate aminotransferase n=1 Tax=Marimonas arenosa TaxID=1795305 RepID=A0AAE3WAN8_9RHOB|nr:aspartate aminotransferase [Marimonas arenosa]MDQ2089003.1 aspartate aminotransferase [Marimonas arenosa]